MYSPAGSGSRPFAERGELFTFFRFMKLHAEEYKVKKDCIIHGTAAAILLGKCQQSWPESRAKSHVRSTWTQSEKTPASINGEQQIWPWHHGKFRMQIERIWMKMNVCENYTKTEREICELVWLKLNEYDCIIQSWNREAHKSAKERGKAYDLYGNI